MFWLLAGLLFSNFAQAEVCPDSYWIIGNLKIEQLESQRTKTCHVMVTPQNYPADGVARTFSFSSLGLFMIFNSYGNSDLSRDTGARVFYFFPLAKKQIEVKTTPQGKPLIVLPSGTEFTFDPVTTKLESIGGTQFQEDPRISRINSGGLEILKSSYLFLDAGFRVGSDPLTDSKRTSEFVSPMGRRCRVKNSEIIEYKPADPTWSFPFRFDSDTELSQLLSRNCPEL